MITVKLDWDEVASKWHGEEDMPEDLRMLGGAVLKAANGEMTENEAADVKRRLRAQFESANMDIDNACVNFDFFERDQRFRDRARHLVRQAFNRETFLMHLTLLLQ